MQAKAAIDQIESLTILSIERLDKNLKLKDELIDLGDHYIEVSRNIDGLTEKFNIINEFFTGQLKKLNGMNSDLLAENAILKQQLKMKRIH